MSKKLHLWEINHPFYCEEEGYYYNSTQISGWGKPMNYNSFSAYLSEWSDADLDMNFIFRWDWQDWRTDEFHEKGDEKRSELRLFLMMQRKGCKKVITIKMQDSDEPAVIKHLKPYWKNMEKTWEGIS